MDTSVTVLIWPGTGPLGFLGSLREQSLVLGEQSWGGLWVTLVPGWFLHFSEPPFAKGHDLPSSQVAEGMELDEAVKA
jgi:hypothetical protein